MRYISIDLSSDNHLQQPKIFGGYAGEHNETILQVKLPKRMIGIKCSGYRFDFQTSEDNKISSPLISTSELNNDTLSFHLAEQLTIAGKLLFKVVAILYDEDVVSLISKTNTVTLCIEDGLEGNIQPIDLDSYKDELQKMVDARILEINPVDVDSTLTIQGRPADAKTTGDRLGFIEKQMEEFLYEPITINSFTVSPSTAEIGSTISEVKFTWTLNKEAKSVLLDNISISTSASNTTLRGLELKSNKTWTLKVTDEKGETASKTATLSFLKGVYYGIADADAEIADALILRLSKTLQSGNINRTFTVSPTEGQKIFFALPTSDYNDPVFKIGGFEYTWEKVSVFDFTNASGHKESYTVWRSVQAVADTLTITVTATKK